MHNISFFRLISWGSSFRSKVPIYMPQHCTCIRSSPDGLQGNFTIVLDDMHIFFKFKIQKFYQEADYGEIFRIFHPP